MPRILHVELGRSLFGGADQVLSLMRGIRERNDRFDQYLLSVQGSAIARKVVKSGITVIEISNRGELDFRLFFKMQKVIRARKIDLLHIHSRKGADWWGVMAGSFCQVPVIISRRVDSVEPALLAKWKYKKCAAVVCISSKIREIIASYGLGDTPIKMIRSGVDTLTYTPGRKVSLPDLFSISQEKMVIGVIAQFIKRKGHRFFLEALPQILAKNPNTHVLFFGSGPLEKSLKLQLRDRGLAQHVTFAGFRKDLPDILASLDLVVHPALKEGLGTALLQASACGVPVVASKVGGIPEIVQPGLNGVLVEAGNATEIASAVNDLLGDVKKRETLSARAVTFAREACSIDAMIDAHIDLYRSILRY